ncbi:MAG: hypothetical protein WAU32_10610 [Thermoanaerobaculia bacterium]
MHNTIFAVLFAPGLFAGMLLLQEAGRHLGLRAQGARASARSSG